jgi:hypothetical protein
MPATPKHASGAVRCSRRTIEQYHVGQFCGAAVVRKGSATMSEMEGRSLTARPARRRKRLGDGLADRVALCDRERAAYCRVERSKTSRDPCVEVSEWTSPENAVISTAPSRSGVGYSAPV